ncbi:MAG: FAD:protein FMN transferase, partial [Cyclobacteriaceae bacterium]
KAQGSFYLHPDEHSIYCLHPGIRFDLGGIGKGFALDLLKDICLENDLSSFVLNAGGSTVLVHTHEEISYLLSARKEKKEVLIADGAVSASGTGKQGHHIFNPVTGENEEQLFDRLWVGTDTACQSDAYGTAFFSMDEQMIVKKAHEITNIRWVAVSQKGVIKQLYSKKEHLV